METLFIIVIIAVAAKSLTIGSDFNFYYWFKYGKKYWKWYANRENFKDSLQKAR
jgi:hypothetical protein